MSTPADTRYSRYVEALPVRDSESGTCPDPRANLRRDKAVGRRPGRRVSRVLDAHVDVLALRLAEEVVYLLHGAERTDFLLGAVGDEPPGGAGRLPAADVRVDDVRVAVGVDRARSHRGRAQQPSAAARVVRDLRARVPAAFQIQVFEVYVGVALGVHRGPPAALLSDRGPRRRRRRRRPDGGGTRSGSVGGSDRNTGVAGSRGHSRVGRRDRQAAVGDGKGDDEVRKRRYLTAGVRR